jgi:hypothetical protein|mmetsp:Transcript_908/g.1658  ORF Transcript_908/g.1658 Transcript_908/m.1658 type:complete len:105 (-) Transcript_908:2431-2745(-)
MVYISASVVRGANSFLILVKPSLFTQGMECAVYAVCVLGSGQQAGIRATSERQRHKQGHVLPIIRMSSTGPLGLVACEMRKPGRSLHIFLPSLFAPEAVPRTCK